LGLEASKALKRGDKWVRAAMDARMADGRDVRAGKGRGIVGGDF
jgi:hypothetical protein